MRFIVFLYACSWDVLFRFRLGDSWHFFFIHFDAFRVLTTSFVLSFLGLENWYRGFLVFEDLCIELPLLKWNFEDAFWQNRTIFQACGRWVWKISIVSFLSSRTCV
ncbi:unnamed protein product [Musa acuminata var. zebrina]